MAQVVQELDVGSFPATGHQAEIFRVFDALLAGEAFILVSDHNPRPILYRLQAERPGRFNWSVLEAGPKRFRIEIRKRAVESARSVSEYLGGDHRRLDAILSDVEELAGRADFAAAARRFAELDCGLNRHIDMEEQVLFPAFEQMTGITDGPTKVMRSEHKEIRRLLGEVTSALNAEKPTGFAKATTELREILRAHNLKEEEVLYPASDRAAGSDRERDELVRRLLDL